MQTREQKNIHVIIHIYQSVPKRRRWLQPQMTCSANIPTISRIMYVKKKQFDENKYWYRAKINITMRGL